MQENRSTPIAIALLYLVVGALWITFSDFLLLVVVQESAPARIARLQVIKGLGFVVVSAVALYWLMRAVQKQRQQLHRAYETLLRPQTQFYWFADAQGQSYRVGEGFEDFTGVPVASLSSLGWLELVHPDDRAALASTRKQALAEGNAYETELRLKGREGYRHMVFREQPLRGLDGGILAWVGGATDITAAKLTEQQLAQAQLNVELAESVGNVSLWQWDIRTEQATFSRHIREQLGYAEGELDETMEAFVQLIHPDDFQKLWREIERITAGGSPEQETVYRLRRKDGDYCWILSRVRGLKDDKGNFVKLVGANIDITRQKEAEGRLAYLSQHDALTGFYNQRYFYAELQRQLEQAQQKHRGMAVLVISVDHYSVLQDTLPHAEPGLLLKRVGEHIRGQLQFADTFCRLEAEHFAAILRTSPKDRAVGNLARQIVRSFKQPIDLDGQAVYASVTIGSSLYPDNARDTEALVGQAYGAMQQGRKQGGNCHVGFDKAMREAADRWLQHKTALQQAIAERALGLSFLPRQGMDSGEPVCFAVEPRWQVPLLAEAERDYLIEVAREAGLQAEIDSLVLDEACAALRDWQRRGPRTRLSLQLAAQSLFREDIVQQLLARLKAHQLVPEQIELRVKASVLRQPFSRSAAVVRQLSRQGFTIAIRGVGNDYSRLDAMSKLRAQALQIDSTFVRDLDSNPLHATIVRSLIALAKILELAPIADGVENDAQLGFLHQHGCRFVQGPRIAAACNRDEALRLLQQAPTP